MKVLLTSLSAEKSSSIATGETEAGSTKKSSSCSGIYLTSFLVGAFVENEKNFGLLKKGTYRPAYDFSFEFVAEVIYDSP